MSKLLKKATFALLAFSATPISAATAAEKAGRKIGLGEALAGNTKDLLANIPWWLPVAIGVILLYISYVLSQKQES